MAARIGNLILDDLDKLWIFTGNRVVLFSQLDDPESGYLCNSLTEALNELVCGGYVSEASSHIEPQP